MKFIVEQHRDAFIAYPLGRADVVIGEADTRDGALSNVKSAVRFHRDTFGPQVIAEVNDILSAEIVDVPLDD